MNIIVKNFGDAPVVVQPSNSDAFVLAPRDAKSVTSSFSVKEQIVEEDTRNRDEEL